MTVMTGEKNKRGLASRDKIKPPVKNKAPTKAGPLMTTLGSSLFGRSRPELQTMGSQPGRLLCPRAN